jgi:hypothetical protein
MHIYLGSKDQSGSEPLPKGVNLMLGKIAAGLFGVAVGKEIVKDIVKEAASSDRVYIVPTTPQPQPQPQPQYHQGGRPVQRGYYSTTAPQQRYVIHQETIDVINDMEHACDFKAHSVGREIAYQIHEGSVSGWHGTYPCSSLARRELTGLARFAGVYFVYPHDGDTAYRRLYSRIMDFINTRCDIIW